MANSFNPDYAIHIGDFIKRALEAYNMTQIELARRLEVSRSFINEVIRGKKGISAKMAVKLESIFDMPATYWYGIQSHYELTVARGGYVLTNEEELAVEIA